MKTLAISFFAILLNGLLNALSAANAQTINSWQGYQTNVNCGQPARNALQVLPNGNLRATIRHGDVGKCKTDRKSYRGSGWSKPYSERAELVIRKKLRKGRTYKISFDAKIIEGFTETERNENFFQIKGCTTSGSVSVLAFLRRKEWMAFAFHVAGGDFIKRMSPVSLGLNKWFRFQIVYRNGRQGSLSMSIDGKTVVENVIFKGVRDCGNNRLRLGVYRGGSKDRRLETTSIEYRNLVIE